mgnify:CR=1 FL=1
MSGNGSGTDINPFSVNPSLERSNLIESGELNSRNDIFHELNRLKEQQNKINQKIEKIIQSVEDLKKEKYKEN